MNTHFHTKVKPNQQIMPVSSKLLQRKCACGNHTHGDGECEACKRKRLGLQRKQVNNQESSDVPAIVYNTLNSPGQPLDRGTRGFMESRFGHDFSQVRIHTGAQAAEAGRSVKARAYTVGNAIVFGDGQYRPHHTEGRRLLAHELTHVVQQGGASRIGNSIQSSQTKPKQV